MGNDLLLAASGEKVWKYFVLDPLWLVPREKEGLCSLSWFYIFSIILRSVYSLVYTVYSPPKLLIFPCRLVDIRLPTIYGI